MNSNSFRVAGLATVLVAIAAACSLGDATRDASRSGRASGHAGGGGAATALAASPAAASWLPSSVAMQGRGPGAAAFASLPDHGDLVGYPKTRVVRRAGPYTWHRADVSEAHALRAIVDGVLTVTAPSGNLLRFAYDRHVEHPSGDWTWIGHAIGGSAADDAILTFGQGAVFGTIAQADDVALKLAMQDGASWLVETDADAVAAQSKAIGRHDTPDFLLPPDLPVVESLRAQAAAVGSAGAAATTTTTVDVVVGYTTGFETANKVLSNLGPVLSRIHYLVDVTNESYVNSNVAMRVRLVHAMKVDYQDKNGNSDALRALTGSDGKSSPTLAQVDAALKPLHAARDQYGADLVSLVRDFQHPEAVSCGVAWLLGGGRTNVGAGHAPYGMSVVSDGSDGGFFCEDTTFAHELGHNMGLAHDIDTAKGEDGVLDNDDYGRFTYSFGYRTSAAQGNFYTVMAYEDEQTTGYRVFSNPDITICGGFACGIANQADNARTLREMMSVISAFRTTVVPEQPTPVSYVRNDVNGDGRADITWLDVRSRGLNVWQMNGAQPQATLTGSTLADGYVTLGLGDFNGDGRADLMATNGFDVAIGTGNGTGFNAVAAFSTHPPSGWDFAGIADFNGDKRSDVLWHNVSSGELYVWLMDGATIAGGRGNSFLPVGHRASGVGDLNGDGHLDLVTTSSQDVRVAFGQGLGAFATPQVIASHPPALWTFGGTGDFDGDGKADVLWHNARSGELYYWQMSGVNIIGGRGNAFLPIGNRIVDLADVNGDALIDVISVGAQDVRVTLGQAIGFGASQVAAASRPGTWRLVNTPRDLQPRADLNGDGRSDVVWANQWSNETYYWLMNGSSVVEQQGGSFLQTGTEPLAIADLNADGLPDIIGFANGSVTLSFGQAGGGFGAGVVIGSRPSSAWSLAGITDMNGDGANDVVWHNSTTGTLSTWRMQGGAVASTQNTAVSPPGHAVLDIGDLNADGYTDVITSNGTDVLAFLGTATGQFMAGLKIADRPPADWALAGIADINQDGKVDITWHNQVSGELYSWVMRGTQIAGGSGGSYLPIGHRVLAMRDVSGDRRPDVLSTDGSNVWAALAIPGGGFLPAQVVAALPAAGWNFVPDP